MLRLIASLVTVSLIGVLAGVTAGLAGVVADKSRLEIAMVALIVSLGLILLPQGNHE